MLLFEFESGAVDASFNFLAQSGRKRRGAHCLREFFQHIEISKFRAISVKMLDYAIYALLLSLLSCLLQCGASH